MYVYVEVWNATPAWLALSAEERQTYMAKVGAFLEQLAGEGLSLDCCALDDGDVTSRLPFRYLAVWKAKDKEEIRTVSDGTARLGWHEYFDQYNVGGEGEEGPASGALLIDEMMAR